MKWQSSGAGILGEDTEARRSMDSNGNKLQSVIELVSFRKRSLYFVSSLIIILLSGEVYLLHRQNGELRNILAVLSKPVVASLNVGEQAPPFTAVSTSGDTVITEYENHERKTLLFVFSGNCPHCRNTMPVWDMIANSGAPSGMKVVGVSLDSLQRTEQFVKEMRVSFFTVSTVDTSFVRRYKIMGIPQTILVSERGTVEKVWRGELSLENIQELDSLINLTPT